MEQALSVALSRQMTLRRAMDIVANNVANVNTSAYKAESPIFSEFLMPGATADDRKGAGTLPALSYVQDTGTHRDLSEGNITPTGNPFDIAIAGDGFFAVQTPAGERYTRSGHFAVDVNGQLVTPQGDPVLSAAGAPITLNPDDGQIAISRDGTISAGENTIGRLGVVTFDNQRAMKKTGDTYLETDQAAQPVANPSVIQGSIESSNVKSVVEMTRMIEVMRAYTSTQKNINKMGELQETAIRQLGREPR
ncbi:flagellar basal-body rod protein FlgF [Pyruvatibacter sp.]|uniref:flagellar basal-body rod protein FlgF n=1 Tax=Pyruvatibacter sp. TaxID=1981328 RepID=UPI0032EF847F